MKDDAQKTIIGTIVFADGRKRFLPKSPEYMQTAINRFSQGDEVACLITPRKPTRSQAQLSYHWVLMDLLSEACGYTTAEMHEAVLVLKFGTKTVQIDGKQVEVRQSVSNQARMTKAQMTELIEYDLELCKRMSVRVPTKEELGYLPN